MTTTSDERHLEKERMATKRRTREQAKQQLRIERDKLFSAAHEKFGAEREGLGAQPEREKLAALAERYRVTQRQIWDEYYARLGKL